MSSDHRVAEEGVLATGGLMVEDSPGMSDSHKWVACIGRIRTCRNEFGDEGEIIFKCMPEHESMDLEKRIPGVGPLQQRDALLLFCAP